MTAFDYPAPRELVHALAVARATTRRLNRRAQWAERIAARALRTGRGMLRTDPLNQQVVSLTSIVEALRVRLRNVDEALDRAGARRVGPLPDGSVVWRTDRERIAALAHALPFAVALSAERDLWRARYRLARRALAYLTFAARRAAARPACHAS